MHNQSPLSVAREAARIGGQEACRHFHGPLNRSSAKQQSHNLVTEADIQVEKVIKDFIKSHYPDHSFIGEEDTAEQKQAQVSTGSANLWIIDPIDGTNNYAHQIPHFSISVAYAEGGEALAGAAYDPNREELFYAEKGKGAFLNDQPISAAETHSLNQALISTGFSYKRGVLVTRTLDSIEKLFECSIHGLRRIGSCVLDLCWVAAGRLDGYFEYDISVWDFAAAALIAQEAGAICTDRAGEPLTLASKSMIAAPPKLHPVLLQIVKY